MYNGLHLPLPLNSNTVYFYPSGTTQIWRKPPGCRIISITCLGGGGGGGAGFSRPAGTAGSGGGGGAGAGISRGIFNADSMPDIIEVFVGKGGTGGKSDGTLAVDGGISYVSIPQIYGTSTTNAIIIQSSADPALAGTNGDGTSGRGGTAATTAVETSYSNLGVRTFRAGSGGSSGTNTGNTPSSIIWGNGGTIISGGNAGGGCNASNLGGIGGTIQGPTALFQNIAGGTSGGNGGHGITCFRPIMFFSGGAGGGGRNGVAGDGGNGSFGSGGGGGGSGTTGGSGGNGGDGLVIIIAI